MNRVFPQIYGMNIPALDPALKRDHIRRDLCKIHGNHGNPCLQWWTKPIEQCKRPRLFRVYGGLYYPVLWGLYYTVMSSMTGPLSYEQVHTRISRTKPSWWADGPAFGILLCSSVIATNGWCRWPLRSENKKPGCLGYMADSTTQFYGALYETLIYKHPYSKEV